MSKRLIIIPNIKKIESEIRRNGWSNAYFTSEVMKKQRGWVSEWKRGKNFPSPEEAARMCILLNTTPEEILLREGSTEEETARCQQDIDTVRQLVEESQGAEKDPATNGEVSSAKKALINLIVDLDEEQCRKLRSIIEEAVNLL
ncbi:MAG TPA: hypothetical protein DIT79_00985 [Ruminococcaceae bacterium]|jgi:hypothetical protein|nr:hypothetical protein [Oscillospiraceae bacterium]